MWQTDTRWFDVAVVMSIFAVGSVVFGKFEQHKPRWRRVLKQLVVLAIMVALSSFAGRAWSFGLIGVMGLAALYVHLVWLPSHGINGITAEPYDAYLALVTRKRRDGRPAADRPSPGGDG